MEIHLLFKDGRVHTTIKVSRYADAVFYDGKVYRKAEKWPAGNCYLYREMDVLIFDCNEEELAGA